MTRLENYLEKNCVSVSCAKGTQSKYYRIGAAIIRYSDHVSVDYSGFDGHDVLNKLVGFGEENTCMLCKAVQGECDNCIYKFREREGFATPPCVDLIYKEICDSFNPKDTLNALQKRISYLEHVIQYYEYQGY